MTGKKTNCIYKGEKAVKLIATVIIFFVRYNFKKLLHRVMEWCPWGKKQGNNRFENILAGRDGEKTKGERGQC